jgi:signal transduction histidine kinase
MSRMPPPPTPGPRPRRPIRLFVTPGDDIRDWSDDDLRAVLAENYRPWRHTLGFALALVACVACGFVLGVDAPPTRFAWLFLLPMVSHPFMVGFVARAAASLSFAMAGTGGFLSASPEYVDRVEFPVQFGFLLGAVAISFAFGHAVQELQNAAVVQRRRLERHRAELASVNSGLEVRVARQRGELRALAFHLTNVTKAEQQGLRREVRGDLVPEIERLAAAFAALDDATGPLADGVIARCEAAMERTHLVFRHVLRRLHPNAVRRVGLTQSMTLRVDGYRRRLGVPVDVSLGTLPADTDSRILDVVDSAVRHTLRRWEAAGGVQDASVTLSVTAGGLELDLAATGEFSVEAGVSVTTIGLRQRAEAHGGTLERTRSGVADRLRLVIPHSWEDSDGDESGVAAPPAHAEVSGPDDGFRSYIRAFQSQNMTRYGVVLLLLLFLWWPVDFLIMRDPEMLWAMSRFRIVCIAVTLIALVFGPVRRSIIARPALVGSSLFCVAAALAAWSIGQAGTLENGWAHYFGYAPSLVMPFVLRMPTQIATSLVITMAGLTGFFVARPEELGGPEVAGLLVFALVSIITHLVVGLALHRSARDGYHLGRSIARRREALAVRRGELGQVVRRQTAQLRERAAGLQAARDEERAWMVHEMHDGLGQVVASLGYSLARVVATAGNRERPLEVEPVREATKLVGTLQEELVRILDHLGPRHVDLGLKVGLEELLRSFAPTGELETELRVDTGAEPLERELEALAYRVIQEGLTNILKHAEATRVVVTVQAEGEGIRVSVSDNGVGLAGRAVQEGHGPPLADRGSEARAVAEPPGGGGLGLESITRRVTSVGGRVEWLPVRGGGTLLLAFLPTDWAEE